MDARNKKLEQQRQLMEQKMKQKRQMSGMIQASDIRANSAVKRDVKVHKSEWDVLLNAIKNLANEENPDETRESEDELSYNKLQKLVNVRKIGPARPLRLVYKVRKIGKFRTTFHRKSVWRTCGKAKVPERSVCIDYTPKAKNAVHKKGRMLLTEMRQTSFKSDYTSTAGNELQVNESTQMNKLKNTTTGIKENKVKKQNSIADLSKNEITEDCLKKRSSDTEPESTEKSAIDNQNNVSRTCEETVNLNDANVTQLNAKGNKENRNENVEKSCCYSNKNGKVLKKQNHVGYSPMTNINIKDEKNYLTKAMMGRPDLMHSIIDDYHKGFTGTKEIVERLEMLPCYPLLMHYLMAEDEDNEEKTIEAKAILMNYADKTFTGDGNALAQYIRYYVFLYNVSRTICSKYEL